MLVFIAIILFLAVTIASIAINYEVRLYGLIPFVLFVLLILAIAWYFLRQAPKF